MKVHWETKRGCKFKCGFCEWGNAGHQVIDIDKKRLYAEIELFKDTCIDEINILDGTFNVGHTYFEIFRKLMALDAVKVTCQARFESLYTRTGEAFLEVAAGEHKHKVHLEFGLQTIHAIEMKAIGRKNLLDKVEQALEKLAEYEIDYEVSIIYAIGSDCGIVY